METINIDLAWPARKIKTLYQRLRIKQSPTYQTLLMTLGGNPLWIKKDIAKLAEAGYQNCWAVYSCVNLIVSCGHGPLAVV